MAQQRTALPSRKNPPRPASAPVIEPVSAEPEPEPVAPLTPDPSAAPPLRTPVEVAGSRKRQEDRGSDPFAQAAIPSSVAPQQAPVAPVPPREVPVSLDPASRVESRGAAQLPQPQPQPQVPQAPPSGALDPQSGPAILPDIPVGDPPPSTNERVRGEHDAARPSEEGAMLGFPCTTCRAVCRVPRGEAGQLASCQHCGARMIAPDPDNGWEPVPFDSLIESMLGIAPPDRPAPEPQPPRLEGNPVVSDPRAGGLPRSIPALTPPIAEPVGDVSPFSVDATHGSSTPAPVAASEPAPWPAPEASTDAQPFVEDSTVTPEPQHSPTPLAGSGKTFPGSFGGSSNENGDAPMFEAFQAPENIDNGGLTMPGFLRFTAVVWLICGLLALYVLNRRAADLAAERELSYPTVEETAPQEGSYAAEIEGAKSVLAAVFKDQDLTSRLKHFSGVAGREPEVQRVFEEPDTLKLQSLVYGQTHRIMSGESKHLFQITTNRNPKGTPVVVYSREGSFKIPWGPFYQFHEGTLEAFVDQKASDSQMFFVILKKAHRFSGNPGVPESYEKLELGGFGGSLRVEAYFDPSKASLAEAINRMRWNVNYELVVRVQWVFPEEAGTQPFLMLEEISQVGWD